jgi:hypothetical protein
MYGTARVIRGDRTVLDISRRTLTQRAKEKLKS